MNKEKNKYPYLIDLIAGADIKKGQAVKWGNTKKGDYKIYPIKMPKKLKT